MGSAAYNELKAYADLGASDALAGERALLQGQSGMFGYTTSGFLNDQWVDSAKRLDNTYQLVTRSLGLVEAVAGGAGLAGSILTAPASCITVLGCFANAATGAVSYDALYTGSNQMVSGQPEFTMLNQALQGLGLSPEAAGYAEFVFGVGAAAKVGSIVNPVTTKLGVGVSGAGGLGKITGDFSAIKPGPLADNLAETFSGGKYTSVVLKNDTVLYRAGTADKPLGEFFSLEPPAGVLQTRIDKAVLPEWPSGAKSPIDTYFAIKIPAGTQIYVGEVGAQSGFYVGGTQQVVIPKPWAIDGVRVINSSALK